MEEFVLPELWHVVVTEENQVDASNWRMSGKKHVLISVGNIVGVCYPESSTLSNHEKKGHNPKNSIKSYGAGDWDFGVEITTEQFYEYVLERKPEFNNSYPIF